ncbi:hypothetical protein [Streptomyces clavifer]|uniref:hypothetical protein n=1 Tax=Streptomyces clavifer TaxID=68188 RepID=UPI00364D50C0
MYLPDRPEGETGVDAEAGADFEEMLRLALDTPEIRRSLGRAGVRTGAGYLVSLARDEADVIRAAAGDEYAAYRRLRASVEGPGARCSGRPRGRETVTVGRGLLEAMAVLAPLLSAAAATIFLLLGQALRLAGTQRSLADALVDAGWTSAVVAGVTAVVAGIALVLAAARNRAASGPCSGCPRHQGPAVTEARAAWRGALLERGLLPFLRHQSALLRAPLPEGALPAALPSLPGGTGGIPLPEARSRPGWASPDFTAPGFASPGAPGRD